MKMMLMLLCLLFIGCDGLGIQGKTKVCTGGSSGFVFELDVWHFSDGSVMTSCHINGVDIELSDMSLYRKDHPDAQLEKCSVTADLDGTPSRGTWEFSSNRDTQATVQYLDPGSSGDRTVITLSCKLE